MRVAVLGCGPAGLMAALAAVHAQNGYPNKDTIIFSRRQMSTLFGAQYLHAPIPGVTDESSRVTVSYDLFGTPEDYRRKVYGPMWDGSVSPEDLAEPHDAWDLRGTYDKLWDLFEEFIVPAEIDRAGMRMIMDGQTIYGKFDMVISSIPLPSICLKGHQFRSVTINAAGEAPIRGIRLPYRVPANSVICNGLDHPSYYRVSNIFGHKTAEWPEWIDPPISHAQVQKPLDSNCDCWPEILRVGRYGEWRKGVLTHHAYERVLSTVAAAI